MRRSGNADGGANAFFIMAQAPPVPAPVLHSSPSPFQASSSVLLVEDGAGDQTAHEDTEGRRRTGPPTLTLSAPRRICSSRRSTARQRAACGARCARVRRSSTPLMARFLCPEDGTREGPPPRTTHRPAPTVACSRPRRATSLSDRPLCAHVRSWKPVPHPCAAGGSSTHRARAARMKPGLQGRAGCGRGFSLLSSVQRRCFYPSRPPSHLPSRFSTLTSLLLMMRGVQRAPQRTFEDTADTRAAVGPTLDCALFDLCQARRPPTERRTQSDSSTQPLPILPPHP